MMGKKVKRPKLDDLELSDPNPGTQIRILCGEPRDGIVSVDLKVGISSLFEHEDEMLVLPEHGVHIQGHIKLGVEKRISLSTKTDAVQCYLLVKIEEVAESPQSTIGGEPAPSERIITPRIIRSSEDDEEKLGLGLDNT
jgi:hypothetical protein